jgi:hypothetical protein
MAMFTKLYRVFKLITFINSIKYKGKRCMQCKDIRDYKGYQLEGSIMTCSASEDENIRGARR